MQNRHTAGLVIGSDEDQSLTIGQDWWDEILATPLPEDAELYCTTTAMIRYARGVALAATGRVDIMVDPLINSWDAAPLLPIMQEAWLGEDEGGHARARLTALSN